jgi:hypothetical protein
MTNSRIYPRKIWDKEIERLKERLTPCIIDALAALASKRKGRRRPRNPYRHEPKLELEHPK